MQANMSADWSRRRFLGGIGAAVGGLILPVEAFGSAVPKMKLGVVSDVHISQYNDQERWFEKALRWFDKQGVDAVMVPGDIAHSGRISELRSFAAVWDKVFPGDKAADGRKVEKLFVTGNHDLAASWVKGDDAWRTQNMIAHRDNTAKYWAEFFHEPYQLIWKKQVKGYTFVGAQWPCEGAMPPIEQWFTEHAAELDRTRPFFFVQHAHPRGTCGDGKISYERDSTATRALSAFSNAVAITGHSHQTITDESSVWQGAFTSINAGCLWEGGNDRWGVYDSDYPKWHNKYKENRMRQLPADEGRCGLLVEVFDDHLLIQRHSFHYDLTLGEDWCVALPAAVGGALDSKIRRQNDIGPRFESAARLEIVRHQRTPDELAGEALKGKPCVQVKIPYPHTVKRGSRVYDFKVEAIVDGKTIIERLVLANGYNVPEELSQRQSNCLFDMDELAASGRWSFRVTPRTAYGTCGESIAAVADWR